MSAEDLRTEVLGMLADVRAAGRRASRAEMDAVLDRHLPGLVAAHDAYATARLSDAALLVIRGAVSEACIRAAENPAEPARNGMTGGRRLAWWPEGLVGPRRAAWRWALVGAAALVVLALFLSRHQPRYLPEMVQQDPPKSDRTKRDGPSPLPPRTDPRKTVTVEKRKQPGIQPQQPAPPVPDGTKQPGQERAEIGRLAILNGQPQLLKSGAAPPSPAKDGISLAVGDRIVTGDMDRAEVKLKDGSIVKLGFNTTLELRGRRDGRAVMARDFALVGGRVMVKVSPTRDHRKFTVRTPVATAEVLGTEFSLGLDTVTQLGQGAAARSKLRAVLQVKEGRVAFFNTYGSVQANAMTESTAVADAGPTWPRRLNTLRVFTFGWTNQRIEIRTSAPGEEEAPAKLVFPSGTAGLVAATVPNGELRIVTLSENASARSAGLRVGDTVVAVNGQPQNMDSIRREIAQRPGENLQFRIRRSGAEIDVTVPVVLENPVVATVPRSVASLLFDATRPALAGDVNTAVTELEAVARRIPHAAVLNNLGVAYEMLDLPGPAIRSYQAAVRLDGKTPLYRSNLAYALQGIGNIHRSVELLHENVARDPNSSDALLALAHPYQLLDRHEDALALYEAVQPRLKSSSGFWTGKSMALMHAGKPDEAIEAALEATRLAPDSANAFFKLGWALGFRGRYEEAETAYAKAIDLNPCLAYYYNSRAINLRAMRRHNQAEGEFRKAIILDPGWMLAYVGLGSVLHDMRRYGEAETVLRKAVGLDPEHPEAHYNLGLTLWKLDRLPEAETMLKRAVYLNPADPDIQAVFAKVLISRDKIAEALSIFDKVTPHRLDILAHLGWTQIEYHRWADAVRTHRRLLELKPDGPERIKAMNSLAFALIRTGQLSPAEALLQEALTLNPDDRDTSSSWALLLAHKGTSLDEALERARQTARPGAPALRFETLGFVLFKRGELDAAVEPLTRAATSYGKTYLAADAYVTLGQVHEARQDIPAAIEAYRSALKVVPTNKIAANALKRLAP